MIRIAIAALATVAAGLAFVLMWELGAFGPESRAAAPRPETRVSLGAPVVEVDHTAAWVTTILARPLLSPTRRPPVGVQGEQAPGDLPRLSGVLVGPFGASAIFSAEGQKPVVVSEGGRVGAWTVHTITTGEVHISGPGGSRTLHPAFLTTANRRQPNSPTGQRVGLPSAR